MPYRGFLFPVSSSCMFVCIYRWSRAWLCRSCGELVGPVWLSWLCLVGSEGDIAENKPVGVSKKKAWTLRRHRSYLLTAGLWPKKSIQRREMCSWCLKSCDIVGERVKNNIINHSASNRHTKLLKERNRLWSYSMERASTWRILVSCLLEFLKPSKILDGIPSHLKLTMA